MTVMVTRRQALAAVAAAMLARGPAVAQERLKVVASFTILADLVNNVGGERVAVVSLVGFNGNAHVFAPAPADARKVADAKVVVVNGLGFEGWLDRLARAAGATTAVVVATKGIPQRPPVQPGFMDSHAWQSVANAEIYVGNIRDALIAADPAGKTAYEANADAYLGKLAALDREVRAAVAQIPPERRRVITPHRSFGYFQEAYGIAFFAPQGLSTEAEPSARDLAAIIAQIRRERISAVFFENVADPRLMRQITAETGAKIGGTLYSDALTAPDGAAPTYVDLIRQNVRQIAAALAP